MKTLNDNNEKYRKKPGGARITTNKCTLVIWYLFDTDGERMMRMGECNEVMEGNDNNLMRGGWRWPKTGIRPDNDERSDDERPTKKTDGILDREYEGMRWIVVWMLVYDRCNERREKVNMQLVISGKQKELLSVRIIALSVLLFVALPSLLADIRKRAD